MADEAKKPMPKHLAELHQRLTICFNEKELYDLCFDMGVDYEGLPGKGKAGKAREFVAYLDRRGSIAELLRRCSERRPDVSWASALEVVGNSLTLAQPGTPKSSLPQKGELYVGRSGCSVGMTILLIALFVTLVGLSLAVMLGHLPLVFPATLPEPSRVAKSSYETETAVAAMWTRTPTPLPSDTPTSMPNTFTPNPTRLSTATRMALTPIQPGQTPIPTRVATPTAANEALTMTLQSPSLGALKSSTITFKWTGRALQPGETFVVQVIPKQAEKKGTCMVENDYGPNGYQYSPPLTGHEWTTDIAAVSPGKYRACAGRIEWRVHIRDSAGNIIQSTPRAWFEWNPP